jgi:hypothetical protein
MQRLPSFSLMQVQIELAYVLMELIPMAQSMAEEPFPPLPPSVFFYRKI